MSTSTDFDENNGSANERKRATLFLMAFNQEPYIADACRGALNQTYTPLEIIISDDCSSDRTYQIIHEICDGYTGPHDLTIRRNPTNFGLIDHVNLGFELSSSDIVILAAGDDISTADRVEKIMAIFATHRECKLVHSDVYDIDDDGVCVGRETPPICKIKDMRQLYGSLSLYIGATGAISKNLYRKFGPIVLKRAYEDLIFASRAAMESYDSIFYICEPLVNYRFGIGLSASLPGESLENKMVNLKWASAIFKQRLLDAMQLDDGIEKKCIVKILENEIDNTRRKKYNLYFYVNRRVLVKKALSGRTIYAINALLRGWADLVWTALVRRAKKIWCDV